MPAGHTQGVAPALREGYRPRPIHFLDLWEPDGWTLKAYGISHAHQTPGVALVTAARERVNECLPPSAEQGNYGLGFVGIHEGRDFNFVFFCWWADENELHMRRFLSPVDEPANLREATNDDAFACTFDLQLIWFERNAWVEKVLANPRGPDMQAYLKKRLTDQA